MQNEKWQMTMLRARTHTDSAYRGGGRRLFFLTCEQCSRPSNLWLLQLQSEN